jgi:hypothetical protein
VVRFTTGEPYLEYLPNMLNKEGSVKIDIFRKRKCRLRSSLSSIADLGKNPSVMITTLKTMKT